MKFGTLLAVTLISALPNVLLAQQSKPVALGIAAPIMLNRNHNGGCGIEKDSRFKAQLDFASAAAVDAEALGGHRLYS